RIVDLAIFVTQPKIAVEFDALEGVVDFPSGFHRQKSSIVGRIASASALTLSNSCWLMMPLSSNNFRTGSEGSAGSAAKVRGAQLMMLMHAAAKKSRFPTEQRRFRFLLAGAQKVGVSVFGCRI